MRLSVIPLAAAALLAAGAANAAVIHLTYVPNPPVVDTDGQMPLADIDWKSFSIIPLHIKVFSLDGSERVGDVVDFGFSNIDFSEIRNLTTVASAVNVFSTPPGPALFFAWTFSGAEAVGSVLATVNVETLLLGIRPHDDVGDLLLASFMPSLTVWDPVFSVSVGSVAYDAQTVPLPAGVFLLGGALAGLGALRRRANKTV